MWKPLENLSKCDKRINLDDWMFMGTGLCGVSTTIYLYKHCETRRYLNLDEHHNFYLYSPNSTLQGEYIRTLQENEAITHALA